MRLIHTITVQRAAAGAVDDRGIPAQTWSTLATAQAWVQPKSSREMERLSQGGAVVSTHSIYVEPSSAVTPADRISFDGKTYQIDGIRDEAGLGHHFKLDCHLVE